MRISIKTLAAGSVAALALGAAAAPASAQSYGYGGDPLLDAILRGVIAVSGDDNRYGYQNGTYRGPDCQYYRDGRCYRNLGHWEREHGINSRDRAYGDRYYGDRQYNGRYVEGRTYAGRGYYRDGRFWRNHGQWRSAQNHNRDYRYDRRW